MDILDKIETYTRLDEEALNESFANYMKKYFPDVNIEKELMYVPGLTVVRMFMNNNLFGYLNSRVGTYVTDVMGNRESDDGFDLLIRREFDKVMSQYDMKVLNSAIYKAEELRKPGKMNKKEQAEFKKFKSFLGKFLRKAVKEYEAIAADLKLNTSKLAQWAYGTSPKKEKEAFETWVKKAFGLDVKTKNSSWGVTTKKKKK